MSGVDAVLARVAEIRGAMAAVQAPRVVAGGATTGTGGGFAAALGAAGVPGADAASGVAGVGASGVAGVGASGAVPAAGGATATGAASGAARAATGTSGQATGAGLVEAASRYLGVPYVWGGEDPATGLDCSGLVQVAMGDLGVDVPRVARDQARLGTAVPSLAEARPGDLLIFDGGSHIGIYAGDGRMVDAPKPGTVVTDREVYETPTAIRRVLPQAAAAVVPDVAAVPSAQSVATQSVAMQSFDLQRYAMSLMSEEPVT
jgi:cell wall-associated NlpC family hydrolase